MRHPKDMSRRQFLTRAGGTAIAMPSLAAILAACSKPSTGSGGGSALDNIPIATLDAPTELPTVQDPIPADTPIESGPLVLYNWADYIYKKVVGEFEDKFGVDVQIATFNNLEEGIQKVVNGQIEPDVFVPTPGYLRRLVAKDLLQPLQHDLIPNMANVWPSYSNPGPYYDLNWHYSVPYTIYTWGVAYRRDRIDDADAAQQGWEALWNHDYAGEISLYDSYGDTIAITILRNGSLDVNSQDPAVIEAAKEAILQTINDNEARLTINGVYAKLPAGDYTVAEAWSGDIVGASIFYLPPGVEQRHPRLLEARGRQDDDRQRPVGGSEGLEEPTPCPRVHQLHARREERVRQLLGVQRLPAPVHVDQPGHTRRRRASSPKRSPRLS